MSADERFATPGACIRVGAVAQDVSAATAFVLKQNQLLRRGLWRSRSGRCFYRRQQRKLRRGVLRSRRFATRCHLVGALDFPLSLSKLAKSSTFCCAMAGTTFRGGLR